jgi:Bifunctional DNA primase/polymerase, N-terminal
MMRNAALRYAERGWPVFPCSPKSKIPLYESPHPRDSPERATCRGECGRWGHGVLDATVDQALITEWWTRTPAANIGLACGAPGPDVVDFDIAHDKPGQLSFERLKDAGLLRGPIAVVTTPSGGWHVFFCGSQEPQGNGALARHGVDFRGAGGYVVAPPSATPAGSYTLVEHREPAGIEVSFAAIRALLAPPRIWIPRSEGTPGSIAGLIRVVTSQREGNRNSALYWAARCAVDANADAGAFNALLDAAIGTGLPSSEAERTIQSAQRGGTR